MNLNQKKILRNIIGVLFILGVVIIISYLQSDETNVSQKDTISNQQTADLTIQSQAVKKLPELPSGYNSAISYELPELPQAP